MSVEITPNGTRGTSTPPVPGWFTRGALGLMVLFYRASGGRMKMGGVPLLVLHTVGSKSGQARAVPLTWFLDGPERWLVVGLLGGAARHPGWFFNLARNPDQVWIEIGTRKLKVRPESLRGAERDQAYARIVAAAPRYGKYQKTTDRQIPVVRLTPA